MESVEQQQPLIEALLAPGRYDHPVEEITLIETHISWVILTGPYAYKIKKGVDFGFLDYATLAKRHHQCEEELRLNRRTAPGIYLEVVPIGGTTEEPQLHREPAVEYAVKMRQFPQQALLSQQLQAGEVTEGAIIQLADAIAAFHATIEVAPTESPYGTPDAVYYPVNENFEQVRERLHGPELLQRLDSLEQLSRALFEQHQANFAQRKTQGFIRDCHGDLHLNNILLLEGKPMLFDCIEFNPSLRIIDVISELAFLVMDLEQHQRRDLAALLLNRYLEGSGDYEGLRLMPFYLGYRAMVRAKVALLRLDQSGLSTTERGTVMHDFTTYLEFAEGYAHTDRGELLITHGLSGSGKTTLTQPLLSAPKLIRLRSDVERKRLFGIAPLANSHSSPGGGIYSADASKRTYQRLIELATAALEGGYRVLVDATFLQRKERDRFRQLAKELGLPFTLLHFEADTQTLRERLASRQHIGGDASEADIEVLQHQLAHYQPLGEEERADCITAKGQESNTLKELHERLLH